MTQFAYVGIDFGTSGIGYAFSLENHINKIHLSDLPGQSSDNKVPTEIILSKDLKDVLAFGANCKSYISANDKETYEYFKDIKMNLYKKVYRIKSSNGKEADIKLIISKILEEISKNAITQIKRFNNQIREENIKWILTVPAIWEEKSKQIMVEAAIDAGLIKTDSDKSLFLALEPEVAGIFYAVSYLHDKNNVSLMMQEGRPYIVCDIGAGTVDICTHRRILKNTETIELNEEYPPLGGDYGGNKINEEFINKFIVDIFGKEKVKKMKTETAYYRKWSRFERDIEELKISCSEQISDSLLLDCSLFHDRADKKTLNDYISEYYKKGSGYKYKIKEKDEWELEFDSKVFKDIIEKLSEKIFAKIEEIYKKVNTRCILLTGAGSKNITLIHFIERLASQKNITIELVTSTYPETAIIKGAVLFGFQRDIIRKRKARYTLGIGVEEEWKDKFEVGGRKIYRNEEKKYYCDNLFSKFITIYQYINFDDVVRHHYIAPSPNTNIIFYKTYNENCTYTNEKDENGSLVIHEFGRVTFNIGEDYDRNNKNITIEMKLGGTYIDVKAIYEKTGKTLNCIQYFN